MGTEVSPAHFKFVPKARPLSRPLAKSILYTDFKHDSDLELWSFYDGHATKPSFRTTWDGLEIEASSQEGLMAIHVDVANYEFRMRFKGISTGAGTDLHFLSRVTDRYYYDLGFDWGGHPTLVIAISGYGAGLCRHDALTTELSITYADNIEYLMKGFNIGNRLRVELSDGVRETTDNELTRGGFGIAVDGYHRTTYCKYLIRSLEVRGWS